MIAVVGDIHGDFSMFNAIVQNAKHAGANTVIQVGDFGVYPTTTKNLLAYEFELPVIFVDGNHEHFEMLEEISKDNPSGHVNTNLVFAKRGTQWRIDGKEIGFVGGAASVDKAFRVTNGWYWSQKEVVTHEHIKPLLDSKVELDLLITHCPPQRTIQKHFNPMALVKHFGLPITWRDPSADRIEELWVKKGKPQLYCGHMHRSVTDDKVRILDINEMVLVP